MLRLLLERGGLDPDYPDENGTTLLHALCSRDFHAASADHRTQCAAILLDAGARISATGDIGITPLALARLCNVAEMVEFLTARGAV